MHIRVLSYGSQASSATKKTEFSNEKTNDLSSVKKMFSFREVGIHKRVHSSVNARLEKLIVSGRHLGPICSHKLTKTSNENFKNPNTIFHRRSKTAVPRTARLITEDQVQLFYTKTSNVISSCRGIDWSSKENYAYKNIPTASTQRLTSPRKRLLSSYRMPSYVNHSTYKSSIALVNLFKFENSPRKLQKSTPKPLMAEVKSAQKFLLKNSQRTLLHGSIKSFPLHMKETLHAYNETDSLWLKALAFLRDRAPRLCRPLVIGPVANGGSFHLEYSNNNAYEISVDEVIQRMDMPTATLYRKGVFCETFFRLSNFSKAGAIAKKLVASLPRENPANAFFTNRLLCCLFMRGELGAAWNVCVQEKENKAVTHYNKIILAREMRLPNEEALQLIAFKIAVEKSVEPELYHLYWCQKFISSLLQKKELCFNISENMIGLELNLEWLKEINALKELSLLLSN